MFKISLVIIGAYLAVGVFMNLVVPYSGPPCNCPEGALCKCVAQKEEVHTISGIITMDFWKNAAFWPKNLIEYRDSQKHVSDFLNY